MIKNGSKYFSGKFFYFIQPQNIFYSIEKNLTCCAAKRSVYKKKYNEDFNEFVEVNILTS